MDRWRNSQRLPLRCVECARRRVRCDKKAPCSQCVARDRAHLCTREVVRIRGRLAVAAPVETESSDLVRENSKLRDRLSELELALMLSVPHQVGTKLTQDDTKHHPLLIDRNLEVQERMGAILDDWNLGVTGRRPSSGAGVSEGKSKSFRAVQRLPTHAASTYILKYSLETLGWIHCAVRADQFMEEHEKFQQSRAASNLIAPKVDHGWMAVYLSLLLVGLFFMPPMELSLLDMNDVLVASDTQELCQYWYKCVFHELELANAIATPSLSTVQVTAILTLCNSHFGESFRESNLASIAINTARALNMHRLGTESSYSPGYIESMAEWKTREDRDLGRRLWWSLTICDWLAATRRRPTSIDPASFNTEIRIGHSDGNIVLNEPCVTDNETLFSPLLHHVALSRVARQVYDYTHAPRKSPAILSRFFARLQELEDEFLSQVDRLASLFMGRTGDPRSVPAWVTGQRVHYCCTLHLIRLTFSRILIQPSLPNLPVISEIREQATKAAMNVVRLGNAPEVYRLMWVFNSATIAAGVFLCLDALMSVPECDAYRHMERREAARSCINALLRNAHKTKICRDGSGVLSWLLELDVARQRGEMTSAQVIRAIVDTSSTTENRSNSLSTHPLTPQVGNPYSETGPFQDEWNLPAMPSEALGCEQWDFDMLLNSLISLTVPA